MTSGDESATTVTLRDGRGENPDDLASTATDHPVRGPLNACPSAVRRSVTGYRGERGGPSSLPTPQIYWGESSRRISATAKPRRGDKSKQWEGLLYRPPAKGAPD